MKAITVSQLKSGLSRYLRLAAAGNTIVVLDRKDPIAEIRATRAAAADPWERLAREGRVKLGTQDWGNLRLTPLGRKVSVQDLLAAVREDDS